MTATASEIRAGILDQLCACQLPSPPERRAIRKRAKVTIQKVADLVGVDVMTVSRWERGVHDPQLRFVAAYKQVLDVLAEMPNVKSTAKK